MHSSGVGSGIGSDITSSGGGGSGSGKSQTIQRSRRSLRLVQRHTHFHGQHAGAQVNANCLGAEEYVRHYILAESGPRASVHRPGSKHVGAGRHAIKRALEHTP